MIVYSRPDGNFIESSSIVDLIFSAVDGGELDPAHVLEANDRGRALLDHNVGELVRVDQPSERPHRYLERAWLGNRRLVEHAGGDLDVLALQGRDDIPRGEPKRVQSVRVEPDSHRVVTGPEHGNGADAVNAVQQVRDLDGGIIRNEERVARLVRGIKMHDHHQVGAALGRGDADTANVRGDTRLRDRDPVLDL